MNTRPGIRAAAVEVRDRRITVGGRVRLHYRDWGEPAAPVVVLLHGSGLTARAYDSLARGLTGRFRIIVPDLRGHGESDRAEEYGWEQAVDDVDQIVRALSMSPVSMVGHAIGAQLAAAYAARRPRSVMRLVLIDWAPGASFTPEYAQTLAQLFEHRAIGNPEDVLRAAQASQPRLRDDAFRHVIMSNLVAGEDRRLTWRFDPRAVGSGLAFRIDDSTAQEMIRKVLCPTLLIRGIDSQYLTRDQAARTIGQLPDGRLVQIPESGHSLPWEQPERLLEEVRAFLDPATGLVTP